MPKRVGAQPFINVKDFGAKGDGVIGDLVYNSSKVYKCVAVGPGVTANAPTTTANTTTALADGYGWEYQGALAVFSKQRALLPTTNTESWGAAAPLSGDYIQGDIVYNTAPAAAGYLGWVCVSSGSPGTWKGFGLIEA